MPKPHSIDTIREAFFQTIGEDDVRFRDSNRIYVRIDGKFIPSGYAIEYVKSSYNRNLAKWSTSRLTKYFSDADLGI